jgi:formylglycine-generating enzyme required for sulfatase activity
LKRTFLPLIWLSIFAIGCAVPSISPEEPPLNFDTGIDPESWALVPAGEFFMGLHDHATMIDYDYEIMVTTVTNTQYVSYLNEVLAAGLVKIVDDQVVGYYPGDDFHRYRHEEEIAAGDWLHLPLDDPGTRLNYNGKTFTPAEGYENRPMVQVTWFGARAYCEFFDARLPSELEWEKAARGTDGRPFPWGHEIQPENANFYSSYDIFEKILGKQGDTTPVGFYNGSKYDDFQTLDSPSPYGLYDMAGNVWQWAGDVYEGAHYRYLRGGSKADYAYNLRVWTRNNAHPAYYSPNVGFRCVRSPDS